MAYKPVQNESAHLTDKPGRSAFESRKVRSKRSQKETGEMKRPMKYEKTRANKTRS
jgi:hypothetical protein